MAKYFNYFPSTLYTNSDTSSAVDVVTNIIARFAFEESLKQNSSLFYSYEIQDGDTPEIVASKYYGSPEKHWIVLMFNNIIDPQYDWPLDQRTINDFINDKYSTSEYADTANTNVSGLSWAMNDNNVKAYYKVVTRVGTTDALPVTITEKIEIDSDAYTNLIIAAPTVVYANGLVVFPGGTATTNGFSSSATVSIKTAKEKQTYYDYEIELNDNKRKIKLLKAEYVTEAGLMNEFKRVISLSE